MEFDMSAADDLRALLVGNGCREDDLPDLIGAAEDAFDRAIKKRPSRSELRMKAVALEKASCEVAEALESAKDLHFFLRMADTLSPAELDSDDGLKHGLQEARKFDDETKIIFSNLRNIRLGFLAIAKACKTLTDANRPNPVLSREGKPIDEERQQIGFELAALWHGATGKLPTASGSASPENPGAPFGRFVILAADHCGKRDLINIGFAAFVRRACSEYRKSRRA
jgi:hypothetical protein